MPKQTTIAGLLSALVLLMSLPSTAHAQEDYRGLGYFLMGSGVFCVIFALVACIINYRKTGRAVSWLLFPVWVIVAFFLIYILLIAYGGIYIFIHDFLAR
jgi:hypothetical protein